MHLVGYLPSHIQPALVEYIIVKYTDNIYWPLPVRESCFFGRVNLRGLLEWSDTGSNSSSVWW